MPQKVLTYGVKKSDSIYLTFDDGPNSSVTPRLLQLLAKYKIVATFFVIAEASAANPSLLREMHEKGHVIGNHSFYHNQFSSKPLDDQLEEIKSANSKLTEITNQQVSLFRPPQGKWSLKLLYQLKKMNMSLVHWSRDSFDCRERSSREIINEFCNNPIHPGDVVLFHDDDEKVLEILEEMIPIWQSQNLEFSVLDFEKKKQR